MLRKENITIKENMAESKFEDDILELNVNYNGIDYRMHYACVSLKNEDEKTAAINEFIELCKEADYILNNKTGKTEDEIRENYLIDKIFRQGGKTEKEYELVDYYYLKRKEIEGIKYIITDEEINVSTSGTSFIYVIPRDNPVNKKELLSKRAEVIKIAKEKDISISYKNKTKATIDDIWDDYIRDIKRSNELYSEMKNRWEYIRDERGIHIGATDDKFLDEVTRLKWEYNELIYGGRPISKINSIKNHVDRLYDSLKGSRDNYIINKIYL